MSKLDDLKKNISARTTTATSAANVSKKLTRKNSNLHTTKSGKTIKINHTLVDRFKAKKDLKSRKRAEKLALMPKSRIKRFFWRLHPKRLFKYWFSKEGLIMGLKLTGIGITVLLLLVIGIFAYFRKDLPNIKDISVSSKGGSVRYYDRSGQTLLWEDYDSFKRIPVKDEEISDFMKKATVAIEDKDFYKHGGFNLKGIVRASINNASGGNTQGGSTITQQLVKQTRDWSNDHTITRKVKELILSVELERSYSKKEILVAYLNIAPYGGLETGVESASQTYFHKSAKDLTIAEAALLATIPKSPTAYSPYSAYFSKPDFISRQHYIIDQMSEQGLITTQQRDDAKKVDIVAEVKPRSPTKFAGIKAFYFVQAAKEELEQNYTQSTYNKGGWKVTTTLDLNLQGIAEDVVAKGITRVRANGGDTAAFAAEDIKTGQMVALVGGPDYSDKDRAGEINFATQYLPPGSSFKPYDYSALIENTTTAGAGAVLFDTKAPIDGYPCTNPAIPRNGGNCLHDYDLRFPGPLTLRYALAGSRNVPAVKAMLYSGATPREGIDKTIQTAQALGLKSGYHCYDPTEFDKGNKVDSQCYASSAIGDGAYLRLDEHVNGFASLSRLGKYLPQTYILKIVDFKDKTVGEWKPSDGKQVIRQETAYIVDDILSDPNASYFSFGFGKRNRVPGSTGQHKISIKTGTTNDNKDGWMMGFSTYYAAGVWVGHHTGQVAFPRSVTMETMTDPIFTGFMKRAHANLAPVDREKPAGVQTLPAYVIRGGFSSAGGEVIPSTATDLFPSWYVGAKKNASKKPIDLVSNKLATDCTPALAKKDQGTGSAENFAIDPLTSVNTSEATDDIHKCDDVKPTIGLIVTDNGSGQYALTATVNQGTHPLSSDRYKGKVTFSVDGTALPNGTFEISAPGTVNVNYSANDSGSKTFSAQVVDSVLYEASDSSVVVVSAGAPFTLNVPNNIKVGVSKKFTWNNVDSATYQFCYTKSGGGEVCDGPLSSEERDKIFITPGNYSAYVKAMNGATLLKQSSPVAFEVK